MSACRFFAFILCINLWLATSPAVGDVRVEDGKLTYEVDQRGNRVLDFSFAGYRASQAPLPVVPTKLRVESSGSDSTAAIQAAIDQVAEMPLDESGFRGAVQLPPGDFIVTRTLILKASGIVLRGSGFGSDGTKLIASGSRDPVIEIKGSAAKVIGEPIAVSDPYVPVNAQEITVENASLLKPGDAVRIHHPSTKEWIHALAMEDFGGDRHGPQWRNGSRDLHFIRSIVKIIGNTLHLDCPLPMALDATLSKPTIVKLDMGGLVHKLGVENLRIVAAGDRENPADEEHAWMGVCIQHARDCWIRRVTCEHLVCAAVAVWNTASRITVEDCKNVQPQGEVGGWRRISFLNCGQQVLMQRLYSEHAIHDFAVGATAAGPNAFVQCESLGSMGESGTIDSAACGSLFDRVRIDGHRLCLRNRGSEGRGVGWTSLNGVLWNCMAAMIVNEKPPLGQNWSFGSHGQFNGNGRWISSDDDVSPDSLFYAQLRDRLGDKANRADLLQPIAGSTRAPTLEQAARATHASNQSRMTLSEWIDQLCQRDPLPTTLADIPLAFLPPQRSELRTHRAVKLVNGWITIDDRVACGDMHWVPWWNGGLRADEVSKAVPALTRFVPGQSGTGLTDDVDALVGWMQDQGHIALWQHPPLWYDRRRDDHTRVRQMDGEVVAPFYEVPWKRSGQGHAADGLSKWDLTQTNAWYFARLRCFSQLATSKGLILFNGLYMQHSLLEAGAHYVDSPWRQANNTNAFGLPEPVALAGDKLVFAAEQFYNVRNSAQVAIHKQYMRQVLAETVDQPNTILFLSQEYTGPLEFVQLWLDTVLEWKQVTGKSPLIALVATKDVTDAILADQRRSGVVSVIVNAQNWWYQPDDSLYAPQGGKNLAPRQWLRLLKPKNAEFSQVHRTVREYRQAHPDKPFVQLGTSHTSAWAALLAGGSLPELPSTTDQRLLEQLVSMKPMESGIGLADTKGNSLVYRESPPKNSAYRAIDMRTGQVTDSASNLYWISSN